METERIALSQRERDRLRVLHEIKRKQITQIEAARRLKISERLFNDLSSLPGCSTPLLGSRRSDL
jgi:hypothetical protein